VRYTLLEMTQRILEALESDEVNSISDTEEAYTVANIIKECYFEITGRLDLPEKEGIFQLTASGDNDLPTKMSLPSGVIDIKTLKYNDDSVANPSWYDIQFMPFDAFITMMSSMDVDETNVGSMTIENSLTQEFTIKFMNDRLPLYYTTFDDNTILFDSYDVSVNATLTSAKTLCTGTILPTFTMEDTYTPDIDPRQMQLLLQAAKSQAFVEIKQIENPKSERKERRNEILAQRNKHAIDRRTGSQTYRGYGRK
jgi:hypothetical protein